MAWSVGNGTNTLTSFSKPGGIVSSNQNQNPLLTLKKYNVGIVGYGWVAGAHISAINATALGQVTAICSARKIDSAQLSLQHGGQISVYHSLNEMLANPDIHVVSICGYPNQHTKQDIAAAKAAS